MTSIFGMYLYFQSGISVYFMDSGTSISATVCNNTLETKRIML